MFDKTNNAVVKELSLPDERAGVQAFWITAFAVLTAIGAQIEIPNQPVPYTLQTFFVLLAGALLGKRSGMISMWVLFDSWRCRFAGFFQRNVWIFKNIRAYRRIFAFVSNCSLRGGVLVELRRELWWMIFSMLVGSFLYLRYRYNLFEYHICT